VSRLVVDSSVVIKWFVPEVHSNDALPYLDPDLERNAPGCFWQRSATFFGRRSAAAN